MINLLRLILEMMLWAKLMAHISAVKMELFIGKAFLWKVLLRTAEHAVLLLSLELSINIYRWSSHSCHHSCNVVFAYNVEHRYVVVDGTWLLDSKLYQAGLVSASSPLAAHHSPERGNFPLYIEGGQVQPNNFNGQWDKSIATPV